MTPENYKSHIVFEKLEQLRQSLAAENLISKIGIEDFSFLEAVYSYIKDKLKLTNPILAQDSELSNLASEIEAGTVQVNNFIGNENIGHITNAVNNLASALSRSRNLPIPLSKNDFDFSKTIAHFQQTVQSGYDSLQVSFSKLKDDLEIANSDLLSKQTQI